MLPTNEIFAGCQASFLQAIVIFTGLYWFEIAGYIGMGDYRG
jgi:hypothetical protein